jgi:hypothetical protein
MSQIGDSVKSDKIKALALAKECYAMKLELLTNATVVDDVIKFVRQQKSLSYMDINRSNANKEDKEESTEPDYGDKEEEDLEEKTGEKPKEDSIRTMNKIF